MIDTYTIYFATPSDHKSEFQVLYTSKKREVVLWEKKICIPLNLILSGARKHCAKQACYAAKQYCIWEKLVS